MKKLYAAAITAALLLPAAGVAAAQDETITIEGLIFVDRDGDGVFDAGESPKAGVPMAAVDIDSQKIKWEFTTGADGRYKAVVPKGPKYSVAISFNGDYTANRAEWVLWESRTDADFALNGYFVSGFTFVDANGDGEKQGDEKTHGGKIKVAGKSASGAEVNVETAAGPDGAYNVDLPIGNYTLTAPDLSADGLSLAKPKSEQDIDWLTGTYQVSTAADIRNKRLDLRYFEPKADSAVEDVTISPAKDTYTVGEQIDIKFKLANKGDVPGKLSAVMFNFGDVKVLSRSGNVTGANDDFVTVEKVLPGGSVTVEMKLELTSTELTEIYPFAHPFVGPFKDVDRKNQGLSAKKPIKVVAKSTTTPTTPPSETTAPTTTTTAPAVVNAGKKDDLALTGASPLGFVALGGLLLVAGAGVFLGARRRRS